jgi:hypothetical protein
MAAQDLLWEHAQAFLIVLVTDELSDRQAAAVSKAVQVPVKSAAEALSVEEAPVAAKRQVPTGEVEDPVADGVAEETMLSPMDTACSLSQGLSDEYIRSSKHGGMKNV